MKLLYVVIASVALHLASLQAVAADNQNAGYEERPWKKLQNPANDGIENIINTPTSATIASVHSQMYSQPEKAVGRTGRRANRKKRPKKKKSSKSSGKKGKSSGVSTKNSGKGKGSNVLKCESDIIDIPSNKGKGKGGKKKKGKKNKKSGSRRSQNESSLVACVPSTQPSAAPTQSMSPSTNPVSLDIPNDTTDFPSLKPSTLPSKTPSVSPSLSQSPSRTPSADPSSLPSSVPTANPNSTPSVSPSLSQSPSRTPSADPSSLPSSVPSTKPSSTPSVSPSLSQSPSRTPSADPSSLPSSVPSMTPSLFPSCQGSCESVEFTEFPYLTPECDCVADPCDACPTGTVCIQDDSDDSYFCLDCTCGACNLNGNPCCKANSQKNNCVPAHGTNGDSAQCNLQNDFFSFLSGSGNVCSGNEFKDIVKSACGCKPNSASPCVYEKAGCSICTAQDFFNGDEDCNACRSCLEDCSSNTDTTIEDCFDEAATYLDFADCFETIDTSCRSGCDNDCTKD